MKISPDGRDGLGGTGDGRIYINGSVPPGMENFHAGGWDWISSDGDIIGGNGSFDGVTWKLWSYQRSSQRLALLDDTKANVGASAFFASGSNHWLAFLASNPQLTYDEAKHTWLNEPALDVNKWNDKLLTDPDHSYLKIIRGDGSQKIVGQTFFNAQLLSSGSLLRVSEQGALFIDEQPYQYPSSSARGAKAVSLYNGDIWVVQWNDGLKSTVVYRTQPIGGELYGYVISQDEHDFNPDISFCPSTGFLVVLTGLNQGETGQRYYELDLFGQKFRVNNGGWQNLTLVKMDSTPIPPVAAFNHAIMVAVYKDPEAKTASQAEIVVNQGDQTANRPYFVHIDSIGGSFKGHLQGIYCEDPTIATQLCKKFPNERIIYCHDSLTTPIVPNGFRKWDQIWLELYLNKAETLQQSVDRWKSNLQTLVSIWKQDIGVVVQLYSMGGAPPNELFTVNEVLSGIPYLSPLVNSSQQIKVVAPFEYLRANGIVAHPEYQQVLDQIILATPGMPTFEPINPTPPPATLPKSGVYKKMKVYLKLNGKFMGVDPGKPTVVYADRDKGGYWEEVELTKLNDKQFSAKFNAANVVLSQNISGGFETRPVSGVGGWETFYATSQPDGSDLLYRFEFDKLVNPVIYMIERS